MEKIIIPAPYDKMVTVFIQVTLLMLGYLTMGLSGSFFISVLSGTLLAFVRSEFLLMTLSLSVIYGVLLGLSAELLKVKSGASINLRRLILSSTISSVLVGSIGMALTMMLGLIPVSWILFAIMLVAGIVQGALGGYVAGILWRRYLIKMYS
jgi:hypothetical protein